MLETVVALVLSHAVHSKGHAWQGVLGSMGACVHLNERIAGWNMPETV
jgi:hypothetical protein